MMTFLSFFQRLVEENKFCVSSQQSSNQGRMLPADLESRFVVMSYLDPRIQSGSSPCAGFQMVIESTQILKDCYRKLVSNTKILSARQLDFKKMSQYPTVQIDTGILKEIPNHEEYLVTPNNMQDCIKTFFSIALYQKQNEVVTNTLIFENR